MKTNSIFDSRLTRRAVLGRGAAAACLFAISRHGWAAESESIHETTSGKLRGRQIDGVHIFKGVPYGASTEESGRFLPPQKPKPWAGIKDALEFGPRSWQRNLMVNPNAAPSQPMSEDCLVLNVWTPGMDNRKRPVMLWLHGGGFAIGSGADGGTDGANLARNHDVVVVTINHRLNVFGYLDLAELGGARFAESGNVGQLDIILALEWVRDNIGGFGGDAGNVTVFGHSGGGQKISCLMAMPRAKGLFHRAIVQSGSLVRAVTRPDADEAARKMMKTLSLEPNQVKQLQQLPPPRLLEAMQALGLVQIGMGSHLPLLLGPVVDGALLPTHPCDSKGLELSANVPLMVGSAHDEAAFRIPEKMDESELRRSVDVIAGPENTTKLLDLARRNYPNASTADLYVLLVSESFRFDSITQAERRAALGKAPTYLYLVSWEDPVRRAYHGVEIPFVFDNPQQIKRRTDGSPEVDGLVKTMSDTWATFAKTGNPNHAGLQHWPTFNAKDRSTMVFNAECKVISDPTKADRMMMKAVGL